MNSFLDFLWLIFISFVLVAYLMLLFSIIGDLFRDSDMNGFVKAVWIFALILFPFLTALVYLIARGSGMAQRQAEYVQQLKSDSDKYIREVAGRSPAQEIADAKALLDAGSISAADFEQIKAKALA